MESLEGQLKQCIKEKQGIESQLQDAVPRILPQMLPLS